MDDVDIGKPRLPWTAAGDGVGRATAFGGGNRAPGRGRRPWVRGRRAARWCVEAGALAACWRRHAGGGRGGSVRAACGRRGGGRQLRRGGGQHRRCAGGRERAGQHGGAEMARA
jgi:hypothetical protein